MKQTDVIAAIPDVLKLDHNCNYFLKYLERNVANLLMSSSAPSIEFLRNYISKIQDSIGQPLFADGT